MIKKSTNRHLGSNGENCSGSGKRNNTAPSGLNTKSAPTYQGRVGVKNEIVIGSKCRYWAADLFRQYGQPVPGWLRASFRNNQFRRKLLNDLLREANVGKAYCGQCQQSDGWDYYLHCLWHIVNEGMPCQ